VGRGLLSERSVRHTRYEVNVEGRSSQGSSGLLALDVIARQSEAMTQRLARMSVGTLACLVVAFPVAAQDTRAPWELVWADEFDRDGLPDPARWSHDVGGHGWGNQELQFYTRGRLENARVEDGRLVIEARREEWEGRRFTSARLVSKGKGDWTYGRIDVRAKLPSGRGAWPAIWMLPTTTEPMRWPDDGEIDIMEYVGFDPGVVHGSVHTKRYHHSIGTQRTGMIAVPDASDAFHDYAIEWTPDRIRWFVDGREYFSFAREAGGRDVWPFDDPFHLVLNVAVGGTWGGQKGVDASTLPYRFEIAHVRVWQRSR
jgi:beta-glucanase (GH16 family)